jgi:saccharopepsin
MLDSTQYEKLKPLVFTIGGRDFILTPNAQIWPRALNERINGDSDKIYLVVGDVCFLVFPHHFCLHPQIQQTWQLADSGGNGFDFINGYTWLQRFYTVFDAGDRCLGFATVSHSSNARY